MLDFPNSPNVGDVFAPPGVPGAPTWTWDGMKWVGGTGIGIPDAPTDGLIYGRRNAEWTVVASEGGVVVTVSDQVPQNPTQGNIWWDTVSGQLYIYYNQGTSAAWVLASGGTVRG